ncbi:MAG TPA: DUF5009 domain-containing protein, partial [Opitutaceae bacterium]
DHVAWAGLHVYDLVFPVFVFMMGVAIPFSLRRMLATSGRAAAERRIARRAVLLFILGVLYYGGLSHPLSDVRWLGVLQRFGICYLAAGTLFLNSTPRALVGVCVGLIVGYWVLLRFVPVPGFGAGDFAEGHNLTNWLDMKFLPGRKWDGDHDPEGLLSTLPAIASCLLGVFSGMWLQSERRIPLLRAAALFIAGGVVFAAGRIWAQDFPVIKKIWTSTFVLEAGGIGAMALATFYLVIDVWKVRAWATPFVWVGSNALAVYILCNVVEFGPLARRFAGGSVEAILDRMRPGLGGLVVAVLSICLCFAAARFLYRRKIFLRL